MNACEFSRKISVFEDSTFFLLVRTCLPQKQKSFFLSYGSEKKLKKEVTCVNFNKRILI